MTDFGTLETHLRQRVDAGSKLLLPYVTGGYPQTDWLHLVEGVIGAGADSVEVGLPFSDPVMDGPTIQESSTLSLDIGTTPQQILAETQKLDLSVPLIAMTYYNICFRMGHTRFASELANAGFAATILTDLSMEESQPWIDDAKAEGIENVMLGSPTSSDERLAKIAETSTGFVYAVGLVGVTGERAELAASSIEIAKRLKAVTDKPVLVGVGISTPEQAAEVCEVADGVIIGSALIRKVLETGSIEAGVDFIGSVRERLG